MLCDQCTKRVQECPVCKQNFAVMAPQRNGLAERLVDQLFGMAKKEKKPSAAEGEIF